MCSFIFSILCVIQYFDTVGWAAGRASGRKKTECWGAGIAVCLECSADLHMAKLSHCYSLTFALVKSPSGTSSSRAVKWVCV